MNNSVRCVVDASVSIKQFIPDLISSKVVELFAHLDYPQTKIFVPDLFYIENTNALWKYVRAGLYDAADVQLDLTTLKAFSLDVVSTRDLMADAANIAIANRISAYDASYVALSEKVNAPLLTLDQKLIRTLAATSYNVRSFNDFSVPPLPSL